MSRRAFFSVVLILWLCARVSSSAEPNLADLIEQVEPAVVRIDAGTGCGSGVIVDPKGIVATNVHVIEGKREARITLRNGKTFPVLGAVAAVRDRDIALLKFDPGADKLESCIVASKVPRKGERVVAFGAPQGFSWTASEGIVSALRDGKEIASALDGGYEYLGYARDAKWVQTTAAISPGNSGGPLVSMAGEVVGLNTWHRAEAQNLNFAIDCTELREAIRIMSPIPTPLGSIMPRSRRIASAPRRGPSLQNARVRLELPSGSVFDYAIFQEDINTFVESLRRDQATTILKHANGSLYALAKHQNGVLHGPVVAFYESNDPMTYANYIEGKRHGILKTWNAKGEKVFFGQYFKGKPHGFCCVYEADVLATVLEYSRGQLRHIHLLRGDLVAKSFSDEKAARKDLAAQQSLDKIEKLDLKLRQSERDFKKLVIEDDRRVRQQRVSVLNPEKRARGQARINARAAERQQTIRAIRSKAGL